MSLKHQLHLRRTRLPKLHPTILRPRNDPLAVMGHGNGKDVVFVAGEVHRAQAPLLSTTIALAAWSVLPARARWCTRTRRTSALAAAQDRSHVPVLECLVQGSRDEALAIGCERHRVNRIAMTLETLNQLSCLNVPDAYDCVKQALEQRRKDWDETAMKGPFPYGENGYSEYLP